MPWCPPARRHDRGFTLVELIIAIAIVATLAALAWPALQDAVHRSRRSDAMSSLAAIQQAQERWRANNPQYQMTLGSLTGATASVSPDGHYSLSLVDVDAAERGFRYIARATVRSSSPQRADSRCQTLQVEMDRGNVRYTSSNSGGTNAAPDPCWAR
jgi:type IV pilus assembly protein PilE